MDPVQTFKDDPLRMLRAVRFKSRFPDFQVAPELIEAMKDPQVQAAYKSKVSPERAGPELMKTMVGVKPEEGVRLLFDTDLYKGVFNVPDMESISPDGIKMDQRTPWHKYNLMDHTLEVVRNLNNMMTEKGEDDKMRGLMNLSAVFHDFGKMKSDIPTEHPKNPGQMQYINHEVASARMAEDILKSIGVGKDDRDVVHQVIRQHMVPHSIGSYGNKGRANFLRKTRMHGKEEEHKDLWKYIFYHAMADDMSSQPDDYDAAKRQDEFDRFQQYVEKPPTPPKLLVNGNDVKTLFPNVPPGPWISQVLGEMQARQDSGEFSTYEEAMGVLKTLTPQINTGDNNMTSNWYGKMKISQQSRPQPLPKEDEKDVVKGPLPHESKYQVGMRVNDRRKGVALKQEYGEVKNIEGTTMKIVWFNSQGKREKEEYFDIVQDTIPLSLIVGTGN
jgi:tRNA nucleotidyltransferase/poly(A) polymerase